MCIVRAFFRNVGLFDLAFFRKKFQIFIIEVINLHSLVTDFFVLFQLSIKICSIQFTGQIRRPIIHPAVFIHLPAEKFAAGCSFFSENLSFFLILIPIEQNCTALSHCVILRLMEAVAAKISDGSQCFSFIVGVHTLSCIFHNLQIMPSGNIHNCIHLTGNSRIVNRNNCSGFFCDRLFDQFFINVHGIRTDIHKHNLRSAQYKSICC